MIVYDTTDAQPRGAPRPSIYTDQKQRTELLFSIALSYLLFPIVLSYLFSIVLYCSLLGLYYLFSIVLYYFSIPCSLLFFIVLS